MQPPQPAPTAEASTEDCSQPRDELTPAQEQALTAQIQTSIQNLRARGALAAPGAAQAVTYSLPLRLAPGSPDYAGYRVSAFADHDPSGAVLDYNGGARTYNGHRGTDYALWPFPWNKVDAGEVQVIAAAAGTIAYAANVDASDHNCGGSSSDPWNYIALVHADGRLTIYGHLRYNSLTSKTIGQSVEQGEYLGTAASSGNSSGAHLHFEVRYGSYSNAEWLDPYAGPKSQAQSLWANQRPYLDSAINKLSTHSAPPATPDLCLPSIPNLQDSFTAPARVYFYAFYRDYQSALATDLKLYRPDGSLYRAWQHAPGGNSFNSFLNQGWVVDLSASDPSGTWRLEAAYNGQVYSTDFTLDNGVFAARDDRVMTLINTPVSIDVLGNDANVNHAPMTITALGQPGSGQASLVDARILYAPSADFAGKDVFTYTVSTGTDEAIATVTVYAVAEILTVYLPSIQR